MKQSEENTRMEVSKGITQEGIVVGNNFDKYASKNPIVKWIMHGFESSLHTIVSQVSPNSIHEIGCGEGYWSMEYAKNGYSVRGSDFSSKVIEIAKSNALSAGQNSDIFSVRSIYELEPEIDGADLIVCCEVLEHLDFPAQALESLLSLKCDHYIFSVPREPLWRALNMARLKYLGDLGNTPGHVQHWSKASFVDLISKYFTVKKVVSPFPWTMVYCIPHK